MMIEEFEDLVGYEPHAELDDRLGNKKTPLSIAFVFLIILVLNFQNTGLITVASNGTGGAVSLLMMVLHCRKALQFPAVIYKYNNYYFYNHYQHG